MKVQRMCAVCREVKNREGLIRIAKTQEGLLVDERHKAGGRGAYICRCNDCILAARKRKTFERSFSCKVEFGLYDELERMVKDE